MYRFVDPGNTTGMFSGTKLGCGFFLYASFYSGVS